MLNALSGFGRLDPVNLAFDKALSAQLINESGSPTFDLEDTLAALHSQVRQRPAFQRFMEKGD